jgi:hypothetical protein
MLGFDHLLVADGRGASGFAGSELHDVPASLTGVKRPYFVAVQRAIASAKDVQHLADKRR